MPTPIRGQSITAPPKVDATLSNTSSNTVQNQAVANALAGAYDATATYAVGDLCIYDGILYECTTAITTAEAWDATHWKTGNFGEKVSGLNRHLSDVAGSLATVETTSTASKAYAVGDLLVYQNRLYKVTSQIVAGGTLTIGTNIVATTVETEIANGGGGEAASGYVIGVEAINKILVPDFTVTATGREIKKVKNKISIKRTESNTNSQVVSLSGDSVRSSQTLFSGYTPNIGNLVPVSKLNTLKGICFNKPDTSPNNMNVRLQLYNVVDDTITKGNNSDIMLDDMRDKIIVATLPTVGDATHFEVVLVTRNTSGLPADNYADIILEFTESA